jgi:membrane associated rhomboid family serine protease
MSSLGYKSEALAEPPSEMPWTVPWHAKVPGFLLAGGMAIAFAVHFPSGGMAGWGVSGDALAHRHWQTIPLHMFAHGAPFHIVMNAMALYGLGGPLVARLGDPPQSWLRFAALFSLSGLSGMTLFLAIHPFGSTPMLGASGAIYGLLGLLIRLPPDGDDVISARSPQMRSTLLGLLRENAFLFALLTVPALLSGRSGGLAWEAHLGGLLFGMFAGPKFLPHRAEPKPIA